MRKFLALKNMDDKPLLEKNDDKRSLRNLWRWNAWKSILTTCMHSGSERSHRRSVQHVRNRSRQ